MLHARLVGASGSPIVLLHGFLGSGVSWGAELDSLGSRHRVIVPDLLGFGDSPKPASRYTLDDHVAAVVALFTELRVNDPAIVVGHSFGAVVGLRLAATHPSLVSGVVALSPPLYPNPREARRRIAAGDPMGGLLLLDSPFARRSCIWFHEHPAMSARLVRLWRPDLPPAIARDAARHTWASYSGTLEGLLAAGGAADLMRPITAPTRIIAGEKDGVVDLPFLQSLEKLDSRVTVRVIPGAGHDLPLTHPKSCLQEVEALGGSRPR